MQKQTPRCLIRCLVIAYLDQVQARTTQTLSRFGWRDYNSLFLSLSLCSSLALSKMSAELLTAVGPNLLVLLLLFLSPTAHSQAIRNFTVSSGSDLISTLEAIQDYVANGSEGYFHLGIASGRYQLRGPNATDLATFENISHVTVAGVGEDNTVIDCWGEAGFVFREVSVLAIASLTLTNCSSLQPSTTRQQSNNNTSFVDFSVALYLSSCSDILTENMVITNSPGVGLAIFNNFGSNVFRNSHFSSNIPPPDNSGRGPGFGGGGVILEFSFCRPGDVSCNNSDPVEVSNAVFDFTNCIFTGNTASSKGLDTDYVYSHGTQHCGFGRGGGLAVYFRGRSINNSVTLTNCEISSNVAEFGGGLYVEFGDESHNNSFICTSDDRGLSVIGLNGELCGSPRVDQSQRQYTGGGAMVAFIYYPPDHTLWPGYHADVTNNMVHFHGTYINANMACWGGGVALVSSRSASPLSPQTNSISFSNSTFQKNQAVSSAALDIAILTPDSNSGGHTLVPSITSCFFANNFANARTKYVVPNLSGYQLGSGAVYIHKVPATFYGDNLFSSNDGSAFVVSSTQVFIAEGASLVFESNTGQRGGALVVMGGGSVVMYSRTFLNFTLNQAMEVGGAIYAEGQYGAGDLVFQGCFLRYYQPTVHPVNWNVSLVFTSNSAAGREREGTIYVTSLLSCVWPEGDTPTLDVPGTLCWPGWIYDGHDAEDMDNCSGYITTAPASFNNSVRNDMYEMTLYPGHSTAIPVRMRDDYGSLVDRVVYRVSSQNNSMVQVADTSVYVTDNEISVYGVPGPMDKNHDIFLETLGPRVLSTVLKLSLLPCPPGYTPEYSGVDGGIIQKCKCASSLYFSCNSSEMSAHILPGYCVRYNESDLSNESHKESQHELLSRPNQTMIVVECPFTLKTGKPIELPGTDSSENLEEAFCSKIDRRSKFCSRCASGHAVDVNDIHNCVRCSREQYRYGWFVFLLTNIVPITAFFFVVAIFRISTTSAPMYAFVFFAQMTAVRYFHNQLPWIFGLSQHGQFLRSLFLSPYSIWNLDFFVFTGVICLGESLTVMYCLVLKYVLALYPMILIFASYLCIELYDHNYRVAVWLWRPFRTCLKKYRHSWNPKTSIIDAFATFLMISYTKVAVVTISLLTPAQEYYVFHKTHSKVDNGQVFYFDPQYTFFGPPHLYLGLLALAIGITFVLAPPLFLFLYPTRIFQLCLHRCSSRWCQTVHTFADAFQGCFKNRTINNRDYRYFSGLYLLLRIVILLIYAVETSQVVQLLMQQILCTVAVLMFSLLKPYKEPFYNKLDVAIFSLLALMNSLSFANYAYSFENGKINKALFAINYALGFLPLLYISLYLLYLFLKWRGIVSSDPFVKEIKIGQSTVSLTSEDSSSTDVPDRLLHPENYTTNSSPSTGSLGVTSDPLTSDLTGEGASESEERGVRSIDSGDGKRPSQRATEGSYFLKKARHMKNYSSIS